MIKRQAIDFAAAISGTETPASEELGDPIDCVKRIDEVKDAIAGILKARGSRAEQRLRIYNLQREIDGLQSGADD
jgi:hypothetical protein